jgi:hypothetical protein
MHLTGLVVILEIALGSYVGLCIANPMRAGNPNNATAYEEFVQEFDWFQRMCRMGMNCTQSLD